MTLDSSAKQKVMNLVRSYERIASEHHAMTVMFDTIQWPDGSRGIPGWRKHLQDILSTPIAQNATHEVFAPLYAEIESAIDEISMLSVLLKIPTSGMVN